MIKTLDNGETVAVNPHSEPVKVFLGFPQSEDWPPKLMPNPVKMVLGEVNIELEKAVSTWPAFNSAHEGFAALLEEVDELKEHVWLNQKKRDLEAMKKEAFRWQPWLADLRWTFVLKKEGACENNIRWAT